MKHMTNTGPDNHDFPFETSQHTNELDTILINLFCGQRCLCHKLLTYYSQTSIEPHAAYRAKPLTNIDIKLTWR